MIVDSKIYEYQDEMAIIMKQKSRADDLAVYKRLLGYIRQYRFIFVVAILGNCLYSGVDSAFVYMLKPIINEGFVNKSSQFIIFLPFILVGGFLLRSFFNVISSYSLSYVTSGVVMHLRQQLFAKYQTLPARYYDRSSSGKMISEMIYSVDQVSNASADAVQNFLQSLALVIGLVVVMMIVSWQLTLIFVAMAPLMALLVKFTSKRIRRISHEVQDMMKTVTSITEENVEGYKIVRFCGAQRHEIERFNHQVWQTRRQLLKIVLSRTLNSSTVQVLGGVVLAAMISVSASGRLLNLTTGDFASIAAAMLAILKPMKNLTNLNAIIQTGLAGAVSVFRVLDHEDEVDSGKTPIKRACGLVEFKDVSFHYEPLEASSPAPMVLKNINISIQPGETIALVGRSGGGKSSLISLLPRFYDVISGHISVDGVDIREYRLADLRRQFGLVSQQVVLFDDTIASNIAYGVAGEIDQERLIHAATSAHALEFILQLPNGFDALVGDNGVLLSGGQRQRLAIARAIYQDAPILVLDEATSALDTEAERHIQTALTQLMKSRTTIVIAHRLSTIEHADRIFVLEKGEVVESGRHQELLEKNSYYAQLCQSQYSA